MNHIALVQSSVPSPAGVFLNKINSTLKKLPNVLDVMSVEINGLCSIVLEMSAVPTNLSADIATQLGLIDVTVQSFVLLR
jgi:hypothetical protein